MKSDFLSNLFSIGLTLSVTALMFSDGQAATRTWNGSIDTNYNESGNWSANSIPGGGDSGILDGAGTGTTDLTGGVTPINANALNVRGGHILNIDNDGAALSVNANVNVGRGANGDGSGLNHSAGAFNIGGIDMSGNATGGTSFYNLSGTAALMINGGNNRDFDIGGNLGVGDFDATFAILGDAASITATNAPILLRSSAILDFTLGATGIDAIDTTGNFTLQAGAELVIDGSSYTGGAATIPLLTYGSRADATEFTETISGFGTLIPDVVYDNTGVYLILSLTTGAPQVFSFSADVSEISSGDPVILSWSTLSATSLTLDPGGVNVTGLTSTTVNPTSSTTYTLTASDGVTSDSATVNVLVVPKINSLTADISRVVSGGSVTLSWAATDFTTLTLDPGGIDVSALSSTTVSNVTATTIYTLTASDGVTSVTQDLTVALLSAAPPTIVGSPVMSVNFHAADVDALSDHEISAGEIAGFIPIDGSFWTNINVGAPQAHGLETVFPSTQLIDNSGNTNAAMIEPSVDCTYFVGYAANSASIGQELALPGNDDDLFNSYLALNGPSGDGTPLDAAVLNISSIGPAYTSGGYSVIIYSESDRRDGSANVRQSLFTLTPSGGSPITAFVEDDDPEPGVNTFDGLYVFSDGVDDGADYSNFVIFDGLSAASFTLEVSSFDGGRGAISGFQIVGGTGAPGPLQLGIASSANGTDLDFSWESLAGRSYILRSSTTMDTDPATWAIVPGQGSILGNPPLNVLSIPRPVDQKNFYVIEEVQVP